MAKGYIKKIKEQIQRAEPGTVFVSADFSDIASADTVRKSLHDLVQKGILRRVINGVFEKPIYNESHGGYMAVAPFRVAEALARNFHWVIAPCGDSALYLVGLSLHAPSTWSYISSGPYKTYQWNSTKINFKHRADKDLTGLSNLTILIIQALKALGKDNITDQVIEHLSKVIPERAKPLIVNEATGSTAWVYDVIRKICGEQMTEK